MAANKDSFILYCKYIHQVEKISDEQAGKLFKHILRYVNDLNPVIDDLIIDLLFEGIKQDLKNDLKKWEATCKRNQENGSKGGRPKNPDKPKKPTGFFENPSEPKKPDSDSDCDCDCDNDKNDEEKKENKIFSFKNSCLDLGIDADVLDDWLKLRKTKKATNSETAFNSIKSQIEKAFLSPTNCIEIAVIKSWVGFEAKWLNNIDYKSLLGNKVTLISTPPETQFNRNYNQTQNNSTYGSTYRTPGVEIERGAIQF